ncbi:MULTISPECIES: chloride channel protein [Methylobacterium]|uniref:Chloride channel protein n=1 Tax=Methylobacterium longum TaxID=767694 RepID=A0ABT8AR33_9HYPH|nr:MULTISPECIES: chloride channel protein [Methylobacterium]MCJ2102060.1 chloride channel protein [Methylobacterium sp. E-046]MDN3572065.1 chloride channel protein [Methylobacterium longum]GJE11046.1 Voltage-gated ClC-type chloride channel ClcB [Methylobacterium longum]
MSARQPAAAAGGGQTSAGRAADAAGRTAPRPGGRTRRRWTGAGIVQAPGRLRSLVRRSEGGLVALATLVGSVAGVAVSAMSWVTQSLRELLFLLPSGLRLSAADTVTPALLLVGPCLGGALLGALIVGMQYVRGPRKRPAIDPIEANALHGGRMSLRDSVYLAAQNVISNGCGASVGLEAGYTQIASGLASRLGIAFEVRRSDLRTLVGCGAAGAIAAGFGAPLAGAFYAFELIIGTYSIATLTPVVVAALCGNLVSRSLIEAQPLVDLGDMQAVTTSHVTSMEILPSLALGLICAALGILIMRGVTLVERLVQASGIPRAAAPAFGGLCVGALALVATPQVLSGGHGALHMHFAAEGQGHGIAALAGLFAAKATASAISIGSGFRGGLFFASLFLGAIAGKLFAALAPMLVPPLAGFGLTPLAYAVIGMSALAVAIIGGPLTMTFLALEVTGSLPITGVVLAAVIASSLTVRKTFGYSFATWRFHLRGESIRSPHDVGWIRSLTVGRLMRRDPETVALDTPLPTFLRAHALGSPSRVIAVDGRGRYAGIVNVPETHAAAREAATAAQPVLADLLLHTNTFLTPGMNAKDAAAAFDRAESEALAVVDGPETRKVLGLLTESHTLKRYSEELDRQRRAMAGETD